MDILSYLSELVQTRKFIGVAGLGTLYKKKLPGRYDAETHSFVPPSYTLQFTPEIKEDTVLADFISKKRNVSADTANYFINEFSEGLLKELNEQQKANLGDLGKLVKTNGQLIFEPAEKLSYGFDFYGLPSITAEKENNELVIPEQDQHELAAEEILPETPFVEEPITEEPFMEEIAAEEWIKDEQLSKEEEKLIERQVLPEPEDEPTLESVVADNEIIEENPGDNKNNIEATDEAAVKDEEQLRAEIDTLNFYRSKAPLEKPSVEEHEEVIWNLNTTNPKITAEAEKIEETTENVYPITEAEENKRTPLYLKIILGLLILVVVLATAYFVKPEWFNGLTGYNAAPVQKVQPKKVAPIDATDYATANAPAKPDTLSTVNPVTDTLASKTATVKTPADSVITYEIIGASMHDQKEADGFIAQMKKSGIKAKVVTNMSGKRLKMSIATLKDEESAKKELDRLSKKLKIEGIYIYRNKQ